MADELDLDLNEDNHGEIISRKDKRIQNLSEKYENSEKEKADIAKSKEEADARVKTLETEANFYKNFNQVSTKYQGASEYQDQILEKTKLGLDVEEATMLVLAKEGKFSQPQQDKVVEREIAGGGSAATRMSANAEKSPKEMSQDERRSALLDIETRGERLL